MGGGSLNCLAVLLVRSSRVFVDLPSWAGQAGLRELLEGLREACVATVATHLIRNFGPARQPSAKIRVDDGRRCAWRPVVAGAGASAAVLAGSARSPAGWHGVCSLRNPQLSMLRAMFPAMLPLRAQFLQRSL